MTKSSALILHLQYKSFISISSMFQALEDEERNREEAERILSIDERKRPYNSMQTFNDYREPTEEEMEAFRMKRRREEDPMAKFLGK